jgi:hypothetical protein
MVMTMRFTRSVALAGRGLLAILLLSLSGVAHAHSGTTSWGPWTFNWEVKDGAGIAVRDVRYQGELVLWKASMPVIRVEYFGQNPCGPYADRIDWGNLLSISNCGGNKVCQQSFTSSDGRNWLRLSILAQIGAYRLNQNWFFSQDGFLGARLASRGLQCNQNHAHHPYWRLDFDINGFTQDQIFVFDNNRPNQGWGPGWMKYANELNDMRSSGTGRNWFVRDSPTTHGVWVLPDGTGSTTSFSTFDIGGRQYHGNEDEPWPFFTGEVGYFPPADGVQETDVVFWYIGHLQHEATDGADEWHWVGPWLRVAR